SNGRAIVSRLAPLSLSRFLDFRWDKVYGAIDQSGQVVVPIKYDYISLHSECIAVVQRNGRYGAIDLDGNVVIPLRYSYLGEFHEGLAVAQKHEGEKYGYMNLEGKFVIEPLQDIDYPFQGSYQLQNSPESRNFYRGKALFRNANGQHGYIDKTAEIVIEPTFDLAFPFKGELAKFEHDGRVGYINLEGDIVWSTEEPVEDW
ncbi:MAG: WG repeat-containing protein, partial [Cyanobacteria bacterium P01_C01_bin.147]